MNAGDERRRFGQGRMRRSAHAGRRPGSRLRLGASFALLILGTASLALSTEIPPLVSTPPNQRAALGPGLSLLDGAEGSADAAFAAWLKAQARHGARQHEPPTIDQIKAELREQNRVRDLLGENRWRRLERARFQVHVYELHLQPYREFEQVSALYEDIEGSMRSNFSKLARDWAEHRLGLAQRFESWEQRRDQRRERADAGAPGMRLSVSPRFGAGDDPYLGTKLRLRNSASSLLSHLSLNTKYSFDDGETALRLTWETRDHYVSLEQQFGDRYLGDVLSLSLRFTF